MDDCAGRRAIVLSEQRYTIGRANSSAIRLFDPYASRHHARLFRVGPTDQCPQYLALDGGSASRPSHHGLRLNGKTARSRLLRVGDVLQFGPQAMASILSTDDVTEVELENLQAAFTIVQEMKRTTDTIMA